MVDPEVASVADALVSRPRRGLVPVFAVLVVGALLALLYYGLTTNRLETGIMPRANSPAPDFQLSTLDGKSVRLSDLRGKVVVINFWASWCVPCQEEQPSLEAMWQHYKDQGVTFLGVDIQDNQHDALGYIDRYKVSYPNVADTSGAVYINYGVVGMPETYVVSRQGTIQQKLVGPVDVAQLAQTLQELLG